MGQRTKDGMYDVDEMQEESEESDEFDEESEKQPTGKVYNFFKNITGQKVITEEDLEPVLINMKEHLINKNVAADIAAHLCNSVSKGLVGKKAGGWKGVSSAVKAEMEKALRSILTPRTSTDVLRDIFAAKKKGRPYSIVFVGVNGVGKVKINIKYIKKKYNKNKKKKIKSNTFFIKSKFNNIYNIYIYYYYYYSLLLLLS